MIELRNLILNTIKIIKERPRKPLARDLFPVDETAYYNELEDWLKAVDVVGDLFIDIVNNMEAMIDDLEEGINDQCDVYDNLTDDELQFHRMVDKTFTTYMKFMERLVASKNLPVIEELNETVGLLIAEVDNPNRNIPNTILEAFEEKDNE